MSLLYVFIEIVLHLSWTIINSSSFIRGSSVHLNFQVVPQEETTCIEMRWILWPLPFIIHFFWVFKCNRTFFKKIFYKSEDSPDQQSNEASNILMWLHEFTLNYRKMSLTLPEIHKSTPTVLIDVYRERVTHTCSFSFSRAANSVDLRKSPGENVLSLTYMCNLRQ